jgi:hypothetical protein
MLGLNQVLAWMSSAKEKIELSVQLLLLPSCASPRRDLRELLRSALSRPLPTRYILCLSPLGGRPALTQPELLAQAGLEVRRAVFEWAQVVDFDVHLG